MPSRCWLTLEERWYRPISLRNSFRHTIRNDDEDDDDDDDKDDYNILVSLACSYLVSRKKSQHEEAS
jgi:glutathionyl-hydroquinone reductase